MQDGDFAGTIRRGREPVPGEGRQARREDDLALDAWVLGPLDRRAESPRRARHGLLVARIKELKEAGHCEPRPGDVHVERLGEAFHGWAEKLRAQLRHRQGGVVIVPRPADAAVGGSGG